MIAKKYIGQKDERTAYQAVRVAAATISTSLIWSALSQEIGKFVMAQPKEKRKDPALPFHVLVCSAVVARGIADSVFSLQFSFELILSLR